METSEENQVQLMNDHRLLHEIMKKAKLTDSTDSTYSPGPYWSGKAQNAVDELKLNGLRDFRGYLNGTATSFADNPRVDVRNDLAFRSLGKPLKRILKTIQPLKNIFDSSSNIARGHFEQGLEYKNLNRSQNVNVIKILDEFRSLDTLVGSPVDVYQTQDGTRFSNHYLDIIQTQLNFGDEDYLKRASTFMEIGGGFGANVHVLVKRFENIRKIVYLDISPNLYVAIQYLRHHFGEQAVVFKSGVELSSFEFTNDNSLQIVCILPQDIENLCVEIDIFWNAHSFVEMTEEIVSNYAKHILRLSNKEEFKIYLTSYDRFSIESTLDPITLGTLFGVDFTVKRIETLEPNRFNFHFWG